MFNFMKYKIKPLLEENAKDAAMLYAYCSRYDDYFTKKFGVDSVELEILQKFSPDVMNAIKFGNSYGCFHKNKLVGYIFAFNVADWRNNHIQEFQRIFGEDDNFIKTVTETVTKEKEDLMYIFAIGVQEEYRCNGIATELVKQFVNMYGKDFVIISDATHTHAMPMWLKNRFVEQIINDVKMVKRC